MLENLDFENKYKRCTLKLTSLKAKRNDIIKSINRLQKILLNKKTEQQKIEKDIEKTYEEQFTLQSQQFALLLKNKKIDINKLDANKVAETIIKQEDTLLKENVTNIDVASNNETLITETVINENQNEEKENHDEIIHS